jgi:hypothetical protein
MNSNLANPADRIWSWPDSLDALIAAPDHHTLLFENDRVRLIQTRILPGQIVPLHTHRWPAVLLMSSWSHFIRRDASGKVVLDTRQSTEAPQLDSPIPLDPLPPHTVENIGDSVIDNLQLEIKSSR